MNLSTSFGYSVKEVTDPKTGKTLWFTTYNGRPRLGYSTREKAEQVADELNKILISKSQSHA